MKTAASGIKHSESSKDPTASFGMQQTMHQNDISNGSYGFAGSTTLVQNVSPKGIECEKKGNVSLPTTEAKRALTVDIPNPRKARSSQIGFDSSLTPLGSQVDFTAFGSTVTSQYSWSDVPEVQFQQNNKATQFEDSFNQLPPPCSETVPSISAGSSSADRDLKFKFPDAQYKSNHTDPATTPTRSPIDSLPVQTKEPVTNHQVFDPHSSTALSMKDQGLTSSCITDLESTEQNMNCGLTSSFADPEEQLKVFPLQDDYLAMNLLLQDFDFPEYYDPGLIAEAPFNLCDAVRYDCDNLYDPTEYSIIDQSLFIV